METHQKDLQKILAYAKPNSLWRKKISTKLALNFNRQTMLRREIQNYMTRGLAYLIQAYNPSVIGFEDLRNLTPRKKKKKLAKIISKMIKKIQPIQNQLRWWMDLTKVEFKPVDARNTSKVYYRCGLRPKGHLNRTQDWNFAACPNKISNKTCKECSLPKTHIDTHLNAAYNIAEKAI